MVACPCSTIFVAGSVEVAVLSPQVRHSRTHVLPRGPSLLASEVISQSRASSPIWQQPSAFSKQPQERRPCHYLGSRREE